MIKIYYKRTRPMPSPTTMPWKCLDCGAKFDGPLDRAPVNGCAVCGSRKIFDCNLDVVLTGFDEHIPRHRRRRISRSLYALTGRLLK